MRQYNPLIIPDPRTKFMSARFPTTCGHLSSIKGLLNLSYEETDLQTVLMYNRMIED